MIRGTKGTTKNNTLGPIYPSAPLKEECKRCSLSLGVAFDPVHRHTTAGITIPLADWAVRRPFYPAEKKDKEEDEHWCHLRKSLSDALVHVGNLGRSILGDNQNEIEDSPFFQPFRVLTAKDCHGAKFWNNPFRISCAGRLANRICPRKYSSNRPYALSSSGSRGSAASNQRPRVYGRGSWVLVHDYHGPNHLTGRRRIYPAPTWGPPSLSEQVPNESHGKPTPSRI